ncbi:ribosomal protein S18 acetylase RimI-like enzyme [Deinococcus metalli]|uniref:GNAT family N-acetyltransferase n=1 Tax=Deinococcus metalli TaxID=1141878 RepID=A0A7W8NMN1_9DEIO|nr:GNAT family N-acetyltransferase [Deinococcus metalli]MBB5374871.1 ribosomal protein S18 acetylase RimI-like enzyme [Deinococcus metalli]GHF33083.1 GNAT family N-acetyltransferase [Deinococcus metalli]
MPDLTLTTGDVDAASAVLIAAATALEARSEPLWPPATLTPERLLKHYPAASWRVAWQGGRAAACMSLQDRDLLFWPEDAPGTALYLHKLAVHPDAQGRGLSGWMLDRAVQEGREHGLAALKLDTATARPKLCALYESYGFQRVAERRVLGFDVTLYTLDLR